VISEIVNSIAEVLRRKADVRDEVIKVTRSIYRLSKEAILSTMRGDFERASARIEEMRKILEEAKEMASSYPELLHVGILTGVAAEYVEAAVLYRLVKEDAYPLPEELGVSHEAYLLGLGDVVGELRRIVLERLRAGDLEGGERFFRRMEEVYESLLVLSDIPDALVPGLRSKVDNARRLVESTRGDLLMASLKFR